MLLMARDCPVHRGCSEWIFKYLSDCVCDLKDGISFSLGLISVLSWGIAEVPQIITSYKEKSTEGVSLLFLMTWVVGDFFNLAGCLLEPATLPTQFYMALLYTLTTLVLATQTIYYGRVSKRRAAAAEPQIEEPLLPEKQPRPPPSVEAIKHVETPVTSQPISSISVPGPSPRQLYYMSARSLTRSHTPTAGSFLSSSGNVRRSSFLASHPSLSNLQTAAEEPHHHHQKSEPAIVRAVATGLMLFGGYTLHTQYIPSGDEKGFSGHVVSGGRRLLQEGGGSRLGEFLGWGMAAIYMGGRLPQIWLNISRGTVEGLNPMMFFFALVGNATYVASILVRSTDWNRLKPNMPWLVDAAVCVVLDFFILSQFCYYRFIKKGSGNSSSHSRCGLEEGK